MKRDEEALLYRCEKILERFSEVIKNTATARETASVRTWAEPLIQGDHVEAMNRGSGTGSVAGDQGHGREGCRGGAWECARRTEGHTHMGRKTF